MEHSLSIPKPKLDQPKLDQKIDVKALLRHGEEQLSHLDTSRLDAEVLLAHTLGIDRVALYRAPEREVARKNYARYLQMISERRRGLPIAYIIGFREFWSLSLQVDENTLIPRPETEHLVEATLEIFRGKPIQTLADLGTGSGAVALAIASEHPECQIVATDISDKSLVLARRNVVRQGFKNIELIQGDWCQALEGMILDIIVSNPPYVMDSHASLTESDARFEPQIALRGGKDGLDSIRRIIAEAHRYLRPGGWLLLEHGYDQKPAVKQLLRQHGYLPKITYRDLASLDRVTVAVWPKP